MVGSGLLQPPAPQDLCVSSSAFCWDKSYEKSGARERRICFWFTVSGDAAHHGGEMMAAREREGDHIVSTGAGTPVLSLHSHFPILTQSYDTVCPHSG